MKKVEQILNPKKMQSDAKNMQKRRNIENAKKMQKKLHLRFLPHPLLFVGGKERRGFLSATDP